jgi:hypothetical protein
VAVCLTSTMHSAPMGTSVPAVTPRTPPNRRLRQLQRTARTHRKCERSSHTCAGCLRRRSDCSWRRRSPAYSAAAVKKMMIRTRHRRIVLTQLYKSPCKLCKDAFWGGCCFPPHLNQTSERQSFMRKFDDLCVRFTQQTTKKNRKKPCGSKGRLPHVSREWPVKGRVARRRAHPRAAPTRKVDIQNPPLRPEAPPRPVAERFRLEHSATQTGRARALAPRAPPSHCSRTTMQDIHFLHDHLF